MKTFDEAIKLIYCTITKEELNSSIPPTNVKALMDRARRYDSLYLEVKNSKEMHVLIPAFVDIISNEEYGPENALFTAFITGLTVGIEMEKQDV